MRSPSFLAPVRFTILALGLALSFLQAPACSSSSATSDGSVETGQGGGAGMITGGTSGQSGHPGTGGASGGSSGGAAGTGGASGGSSGGAAGNAAAQGGSGGDGGAGGVVGSGGSGGAGGAGGNETFSCGAETCTAGESYCYSYMPGSGGQTGRSCQPTPAACASTPRSCACLCPPSSGTAVGCTPVGMGTGDFCSCTDSGGQVKVSCAGV